MQNKWPILSFVRFLVSNKAAFVPSSLLKGYDPLLYSFQKSRGGSSSPFASEDVSPRGD